MGCAGKGKCFGHGVEGCVPTGAFAVHLGVEQAVGGGDGFAQRGAFAAKAALIGGVFWVARHRGGGAGQDAAAHAAIGAGGAHWGERVQ